MTVYDQVAETVKLSNADTKGMAGTVNLMINLAAAGDLVPPWWSRSRDRALRDFWKDGGHLSGFMKAAQDKIATIPFTIKPKNPTIASHVAQAEELEYRLMHISNFGQTVVQAMEGFVEDVFGQDNGGWLEIIGDGPKDAPIKGPVKAVRAIDSAACMRTGNPIWPVQVSEAGKTTNYHMARVIFMSQMPSTKQRMHNVGYCAVSRSIKVAQDIVNTLQYKAEKRGNSPIDRLLVGNNISGLEIMQALMTGEALVKELGMTRAGKTVAMGGIDVSLDKIDLPDLANFDEEKAIVLGMYALSFIWGIEPNEVWPITGSKSSDIVALQRARGKMVRSFVNKFQPMATYKICPPHLYVSLDYEDDERDQQRAIIDDINARNAQRDLESGRTTPYVERIKLAETGRITRDMFIRMQLEEHELEDGTPVSALFWDGRYGDLLLLDRGILLTESVSPDVALPEIEANKIAVEATLVGTTSTAVRRRCNEALSALDWLREVYDKKRGQEIRMQESVVSTNGQGEEAAQKGFFQASKLMTRMKSMT